MSDKQVAGVVCRNAVHRQIYNCERLQRILLKSGFYLSTMEDLNQKISCHLHNKSVDIGRAVLANKLKI
jgi:hypothetical protein